MIPAHSLLGVAFYVFVYLRRNPRSSASVPSPRMGHQHISPGQRPGDCKTGRTLPCKGRTWYSLPDEPLVIFHFVSIQKCQKLFLK